MDCRVRPGNDLMRVNVNGRWCYGVRISFAVIARSKATKQSRILPQQGWIASLRSQRREEIATIRPKRLYSNPGCIPPRKLHACHHAIVVNRAGPSADSQTSAEIRFAFIIARCCLEV
jgi:hypothetical protein